jgi:hypothetical protein
MKYKVGDKVRIVKNWDKVNKSYVNPSGQMDHWLGKVMTIKRLDGNHYKMVEDITEHCGGWYWFDDMIEGLETSFNKSHLKTGDIIKFQNGEIGIAIIDMNAVIFRKGSFSMSQLNKDLTYITNHAFDVVAVRRPNSALFCNFDIFEHKLGTLIYERSEPEEMTLAEVCKLLGKEIKIIK